ncbi:hypothetical protein B0H13DRAFT_1906551 [Mycena leptocephala]|nr:hypothetical protein B0H13DRAFT_1906551 [Mycena leptocephala]
MLWNARDASEACAAVAGRGTRHGWAVKGGKYGHEAEEDPLWCFTKPELDPPGLEQKRHMRIRDNSAARNRLEGETTMTDYWTRMNKVKAPRDTMRALQIPHWGRPTDRLVGGRAPTLVELSKTPASAPAANALNNWTQCQRRLGEIAWRGASRWLTQYVPPFWRPLLRAPLIPLACR